MATASGKMLVARKIAALGIAANLAACSVFNPHVRPSGAESTKMLPTDVRFAGGMSDAVAYADSWRWEYYDAVGNDSELRNAIALSLIPIGAAALFFGVTGISTTDVIAGLGIGGASIYGAGSYLQSTPRQRIYLAGSQAIGCAMLAARPMLMQQEDWKALGTENRDLRLAIADVEAKADSVRAWLLQLKEKDQAGPDATVANVVLQTTQTLLDRGNAVYASGNKLYTQVAQAGATLHLKVDSIRDEVSRQITFTEPTLEDIKKIVAGLGSSATEFRPVAPVAAPKAPTTPVTKQLATKSAEVEQLNLAVADLNTAIPTLVAAINAVAARVDAAAVGNAFESVIACQVADAVPHFTVSPDVTSQNLPAGQTVAFTVTGQAKQPSATLTGNVVPGVDVNVKGNGVFIAEVTAKGDTPGGTTQLLIQDGTTTKTIDIVVQKGTKTVPAAQSQSQAQPAAELRSTWEKASSKPQRINVQKALNIERKKADTNAVLLAEDGAFGDKTRKAIGEYQALNKLQPTEEIDKELFDRLMLLVPADQQSQAVTPVVLPPPTGDEAMPATTRASAEECPTGPQGKFETALDAPTIKQIQEGLGLLGDRLTGVLDKDTRKLVFKLNGTVTPPPPDLCLLTRPLAEFILNGS
ncbi:peptidoglycan-binding domain-containing protein [Dongia sedimenti]|uniref:Peptidoglycan-binding domain-containing protein n=1 Tax=Dongia sedimenti TaxID=3064282 RepID=A0ABU0YN68_9PROT|nr:peptidoglycan-binding domain-containing protein [Rhodospirillaceae bacterium R-7]